MNKNGNIYNNTQDSYYITDPSIINNYYTSGMSFDDWVDEQVRMGNATHLLGGVSVVAYNQASYDRAAQNIWYQVHYADNYSGGWYTPGQSFSGGGSGTIVHIGKNESGSSRCGRCRSGNDAGGIQFSFDLYCIGGGGIDVIIGENRNGKKFIAVNVGVGIGIDAGFSSGFFTSYYNHGANTTHDYSPLNMQGWNSSLGGGFGLSDYLSTSIVSTEDWVQNNIYHHWTTNSILLGADGGGNLSVGYTFVPFIW